MPLNRFFVVKFSNFFISRFCFLRISFKNVPCFSNKASFQQCGSNTLMTRASREVSFLSERRAGVKSRYNFPARRANIYAQSPQCAFRRFTTDIIYRIQQDGFTPPHYTRRHKQLECIL